MTSLVSRERDFKRNKTTKQRPAAPAAFQR
jgi:hypothetical protein